MRRLLLAALAAALALGAHPRASMDRDDPLEWEGSGRSFRSLTRFMVPDRNSAEIVSATPDGRTLVYTDAVGATVGIVDIGDPSSPVQTATVPIAGSPTSVAVTPDGQWAVVAVAV